jgi:hypothetical protein
VSPVEKIRTLEGLLARIRERAGAPAPAPAIAAAPPAIAPPPPSVEPTPPSSTSWADAVPPDVQVEVQEDIDDVVVSAGEVVEVDIDVDEPMPAESGAHLVAESVMEARADARALSEDVAADVSAPPANEVEEPAPSSSPRPIEAEPYAEPSVPRHTPPPESGKQVAAPSVKPEPRKSSVPPPSEGHTLLGGWREPGMALPAPIEPLVAQAVKPTLESNVAIPDFAGEAPSFGASSFGAILDATLSI